MTNGKHIVDTLELRRMRGAEMRAHIQSVAICFFLVAGGFSLTQPGSLSAGAETSKRQYVLNAQYEPERLLERDVRRFINGHHGASAEEITAYANSALQKYGYIYKFHSCDFIDSKKLEPLNPGHDPSVNSIYSLPFDLARGGMRAFKIHVADVGPCSYCFALIPALSLSARSVLAVLDGKKYLLKRPVEFRLEEIELVDETMKRVIRKWEVPNETYPIGVSADGRTLYLPVEFTESDHDLNAWLQGGQGKKSYPSSVLAISPTGFRFEVAAKALVDQNFEETRDIPASPDSNGLSFKLVRVKGKTYVIRYPGVCT
jgi:hypothetical protein